MDEIIMTSLKEDISLGDITTDSIIAPTDSASAVIIAKETGVIAGLEIAKRVFTILDSDIRFENCVEDGQVVNSGDIIARIEGNTRVLLKAERTALNFLQRLSGISTKTKLFCDKVKGLNVKLVDTRKTTPGLRVLEKYAVKVGGGFNHRFCLCDGVLIKDNHIKAAGSIKKAIELARRNVPHTIKIEVETEDLAQIDEAISNKADIIMLDNMEIDMIKKAVKKIDGRAIIEVSGNVNLDTVFDIASTGVDIISIGGLTHSANAFDISMKIM
jgi:nicotinate-nucleotide pyrophosphorylase (carboxylating)